MQRFKHKQLRKNALNRKLLYESTYVENTIELDSQPNNLHFSTFKITEELIMVIKW